MRKFFPRASVLAGAILIALLVTGTAVAQFQTGNIYGKVVTKEGSGLPGVTVTLTGLGAPQTFYTDDQGVFRFLNLSPGKYSVKADLAGMGSVVQNNLEVNVAKNSSVTLTLSPSIEQSITVMAEAPLVDTRKTGTGATVTRIELEQIPTARDPWVIMGQAPGVQLDRVNVGGSESGQQDVVVAKGASDSEKTFNVDGVNITDTGAVGSTPTYYDFDSFEEIQITTGGSDPRIQTPGAQLNMVTKRGTNDFKGGAHYFYTPNDWQSDPGVTGSPSAYLQNGNQINKIDDYGAELGGPLWKDKVWFWGAYSKNKIKLFTAQPVGSDPNRDNTTLENANGKINAQVLKNNTFTYLYTYGNKVKLGRFADPTHPPETTEDQSGPTHLYKLEDTQILSQNLYVTLLYAHVFSPFQFVPEGGNVQPYIDADGVWHRSYFAYTTARPQDSYRTDGSSFFRTGTLDHELKFGFGYRKTPVTSTSTYPVTGVLGDFSQGDPAVALLTRPGNPDYSVNYTDLYAGDTLTRGDLTIQGGLRYDLQKGRNNPSISAANALIPDILSAINYAGDKRSLEWKSISPRIGLTYSLGSSKHSLIRASYNRYVDQLAGNIIGAGNPIIYSQGLYYNWKDANGDKFVTRNEILIDEGVYGPYGSIDPDHPGQATPTARFDYSMKAPKTDEVILGFETQLLPELSVGVDYSYRKFTDIAWARHEKTPGSNDFYSTSDFVPVANLTGTLPNGQAFSIPNFALKNGVPSFAYTVITNRPGYTQQYNGLDLFAVKRMSNHWMLRGNVSLNDRKQHLSNSGIEDPTNLLLTSLGNYGCSSCSGGQVVDKSYGTHRETYINSKWSTSLTSLIQLPFTSTFGLAVNARQGYPVPYYYRVNNGDGQGSKNVLINGVDGKRMPVEKELDIRLAKDIKFGRFGLNVGVDMFNVSNERTVLQRQPRLYRKLNTANAAGDHVLELQSPRIIRLATRLTF
ncbi:MAG TPA: carboxypeptidase regulatory-like domain-containing protein [Thermoanaerobaculia bacterium]|nr:carboxypeptidase regulatory-like domain-containing protein [Thermoanaerobaculia bacterium]